MIQDCIRFAGRRTILFHINYPVAVVAKTCKVKKTASAFGTEGDGWIEHSKHVKTLCLLIEQPGTQLPLEPAPAPYQIGRHNCNRPVLQQQLNTIHIH